MSIRVSHIDFRVLHMHTRMPFKYGIATLTALPHLIVTLDGTIDGRAAHGFASDGLPPKWFTKDPATTFEDDLRDMLEVIQHAAAIACEVVEAETVFDLWQQVHSMQMRWSAGTYPPLLANLGVSLIERAAIDAFCRAKASPFSRVLRSGELGTRLGDLHPELHDRQPAYLLPAEPLRCIIARHTVGLADPLTEADIDASERVNDGLPQSLEACIAAYGLTHFKVKLCGDAVKDAARLRGIAGLLGDRSPTCAFTLDGNEQYRQVEPFQRLWSALVAEPSLGALMSRVLFVEQPFHRDAALTDALGRELRAWRDRPAMIIDESDGAIDSAAVALRLGYSGTSFKACKGVFKGVANACLLEHRRRSDPAARYILSGEDLANVGPIALLQDIAVAASLGIGHVERNGHHYFRGLSMWPSNVQDATLAAHGDIYHRHRAGFPTLRIEHGGVDIGTVVDAPFGCAVDVNPGVFTALGDWRFDSLRASSPPRR